MSGKFWLLSFCFLTSGTLMACRETYRVRLSDNLEKSYEIVDPSSGGPNQIAYIDFREDIEAISAVTEGLKKKLPEKVDFLVILGDQANILGAFVARDLGLPWIILNNKKPIKPIFQSISYESITCGSKVLYLNTGQAKRIRGKRIVILDDVLSSGDTMAAAVRLVRAVDAHIVSILVGFTEGEDRSSLVVDEKSYPILKIGHIPVFPKGDPEDLS